MRLDGVRFFADENCLGLAVLYRESGRYAMVCPGDPRIPEIPLGTDDLDWMPIVSRAGLIVIGRERRFRTFPAERVAYKEFGIRSVQIGGKQDLAPIHQLELFLKHEQRLLRLADRLGSGPWAVSMTDSGVRPLGLRSRDRF